MDTALVMVITVADTDSSDDAEEFMRQLLDSADSVREYRFVQAKDQPSPVPVVIGRLEDYPWDLDLAESRGWDRQAHQEAIESGDEDRIGLTHPTNWLTEDEVEHPALT